MLSRSIISASIFLSAVLASDAGLQKRAQLCGKYDSESAGNYYLENNLWGQASGTGSQCTQQTSASGATVAWWTDYNWSGGQYDVKSYANVDLQVGVKTKISAISSIPSSWQWTYTSASSNLVADVSYDLWLSPSGTGTGASSTTSYEIMIWLSTRGGAQPAGSKIGTANVNGLTWQLWRGPVSSWTVFSFVPPNELTNFNQDILPFINYLCNNNGISKNEYLIQFQAGTEPFVGKARLTTTQFKAVINAGTNTGTNPGTNPGTTTSRTGSSGGVAQWGQCGGTGYTGSTVCASPYTCVYSNAWYSQCK